MRTSITAALVGLLWLGGLDISLGQPKKVLYELKERCGNVAREYFSKEMGKTSIRLGTSKRCLISKIITAAD